MHGCLYGCEDIYVFLTNVSSGTAARPDFFRELIDLNHLVLYIVLCSAGPWIKKLSTFIEHIYICVPFIYRKTMRTQTYG